MVFLGSTKTAMSQMGPSASPLRMRLGEPPRPICLNALGAAPPPILMVRCQDGAGTRRICGAWLREAKRGRWSPTLPRFEEKPEARIALDKNPHVLRCFVIFTAVPFFQRLWCDKNGKCRSRAKRGGKNPACESPRKIGRPHQPICSNDRPENGRVAAKARSAWPPRTGKARTGKAVNCKRADFLSEARPKTSGAAALIAALQSSPHRI